MSSYSRKHTNPSDDQIRELLHKYKKVAVVGLSSDPARPSYAVAQYLLSKGFEIIPVNPKEKEILGKKAYPDLSSIPDRVEIVSIFRRPEHVPPIVEEAVRIGAKVVWMQEGVVNHPAALEGSQNGITVVMDRCMARECRSLCGE